MPGPVVGDGQLCPAVDGVGGHGHARALGGVGEGVVEQDTDDLPHPFGVGGRHHRVIGRAQLEARAAQVGARTELAGDAAGDLGQVDAVRDHHDPAGVELGEVEQIGGQLGQAVDLLAHRADELFPLLGARFVLLEQLDEPAEAEDRRPQLVRGVGDELLAGVVELGEAPLHFVEGAGELAQLAGGVDRDPASEVAFGDLVGGVLDSSDPLRRDRARSRSRRERGERARSAPRRDRAALGAGDAGDVDDIYVDDRPRSPIAMPSEIVVILLPSGVSVEAPHSLKR